MSKDRDRDKDERDRDDRDRDSNLKRGPMDNPSIYIYTHTDRQSF
jgi:hypothetical protein